MSVERKKSEIQTIIFDRFIYDAKQAMSWLRKNGHKPIKRVQKTNIQLIYTIQSKQKYKRFFSLPTKKGITIVLGFKTASPQRKPKKPVKEVDEPIVVGS